MLAADITATDERDQKLKMDPALVESLQNVSANLSEAMQKVSQLTNLVLDNVREIASLKAEILQLKSHTPDRASVQQPVRAAGVETYENVPQLEDSDWGEDEGNVPHFVDYWENSRSADAPTEAALAPAPAPAQAATPDTTNSPVYLSVGVPAPTAASLEDDSAVPSADQNYATIQDNVDRLNKFKEQMINEKLNRSIIISNAISKQEINTIRSNFWLNIKKHLRWLSLDFILHESKGVKLYKSGSIRIEYSDVWRAKNAIANIIQHIKWLKQRREDLSVREEKALQIKFTRCTPPKYNLQRRVLSKIGNEMKKNQEILFFDFVIINSRLVLKTFSKDNGYRFYDEEGPANYPGSDELDIYNAAGTREG